ncbi:MAG: glutaredoxin family protein [Acidobacteria bacterium]|nr:glutaredoxin family protein [Acidobacteriota bacterium]
MKIFSKPECHLCDEVKVVIDQVRSQIPFELIVINIEESPADYERFKEEIPVIFINGKKAFKFRVDEKAFRRYLVRLA